MFKQPMGDSYRWRLGLQGRTTCPGCRAVFSGGRWQWGGKQRAAALAWCQACLRARDRFPAGFIRISGDFARAHEEEILNLARHHERLEAREHPLHRIMGIDRRREGLTITTTDIHLPRRIGEALRRAFKGGVLQMRFAPGAYEVRVDWRREA